MSSAEIALSNGISGFVATNTTISRPVPNNSRSRSAFAESGGLSGRPINKRALEVVNLLYDSTGGSVPIVGVGGIDSADVACTPSTNYEALLAGLRADDIIESVPLIDLVESCNFWTNNNDPLSATHVCVRFAFSSEFGITNDSIIDETIRIHQPPSEQQ